MVRDASSRRFPLTRVLRDLEVITPQYLELRQRQIIDLIAQAAPKSSTALKYRGAFCVSTKLPIRCAQ